MGNCRSRWKSRNEKPDSNVEEIGMPQLYSNIELVPIPRRESAHDYEEIVVLSSEWVQQSDPSTKELDNKRDSGEIILLQREKGGLDPVVSYVASPRVDTPVPGGREREPPVSGRGREITTIDEAPAVQSTLSPPPQLLPIEDKRRKNDSFSSTPEKGLVSPKPNTEEKKKEKPTPHDQMIGYSIFACCFPIGRGEKKTETKPTAKCRCVPCNKDDDRLSIRGQPRLSPIYEIASPNFWQWREESLFLGETTMAGFSPSVRTADLSAPCPPLSSRNSEGKTYEELQDEMEADLEVWAVFARSESPIIPPLGQPWENEPAVFSNRIASVIVAIFCTRDIDESMILRDFCMARLVEHVRYVPAMYSSGSTHITVSLLERDGFVKRSEFPPDSREEYLAECRRLDSDPKMRLIEIRNVIVSSKGVVHVVALNPRELYNWYLTR